ncbi:MULTISPECIES: ATP-binding cassette domain-containing protein [unclassified Brenneria]|uniref:ABC transporter ATP-binding protein/permease n=1 Tax=unclassified Brenneria TaxID=2634434 RepID=UPI0029C5C90C|nr:MULTISPECIES: ATP-binding cassette domain-containing protein [unclassified Brenneria]MDX5630852.1 ATP-binding cassette domain-containing protein [Brenneria sp. L3-3Z]MDX5697934.1 ATP-binding cassette domain-containing protein [Brenneria sp. L4-2C]
MKSSTDNRHKDYSINGVFFKRFIKISIPYWTRPGAWKSWVILGIFLAFSFAETGLAAKLSFLAKDMTDALVNKQEVEYWKLLLLITIIGLIINNGILAIVFGYIYDKMTIDWRNWLTNHLLGRYLANKSYYKIEQGSLVDNIDQRMEQEVMPFCSMATTLPRTFIFSVSTLGFQGTILQQISPTLFYSVFIYGLISSYITWLIYRPFIKLNFDSTVAEADLRYGMLHVRNHAETIALYRGEEAENVSVLRRLILAVNLQIRKLRYSVFMTSIQALMSLFWGLMPILILTPLYFKGEISFGVIAQGSASAAIMLSGINQFTNFLPLFAQAAPHVVRLAQIIEVTDEINNEPETRNNMIEINRGSNLQADNLTLQTPGRERTLLKDFSITINNGEHLLILGQTGVGKSSFLRAVAGLWREGKGSITLPQQDRLLFLPQRPYMLLGSLREQISYPAAHCEMTDEQLQKLLEAVNLPNLAKYHGGFDSVIDWSKVLSLGEQQRIGFARALASGAKFFFLDEATSAVDMKTERLLYKTLISSGATVISVGHRQTLLEYHSKVLELKEGGLWRVISIEQAYYEIANDHNKEAV